MATLFDVNPVKISELLIVLLINTLLVFIVVHFIYSKNSQRKDFYFSYLSIGVIVFVMCFLLNSVELELGFALGLFAIFGIIRYRTDAIPIKEMTYLFIIIGISVINALSYQKIGYLELGTTNAFLITGLWLLEKRLMLKNEQEIDLIYEKIENINTRSENELLTDLKNRTGIKITRFEICKIDFLRDIAEIKLYYYKNGKA